MNHRRDIMIPAGPTIPRGTYRMVKESVYQHQFHAGLMLDKFSEFPEENPETLMEFQRNVLKNLSESSGDKSLLDTLNVRREQMLYSVGARKLLMRTHGALTLHLSHPGALENAGIALHPIYGFVYLPGSGLKGLARAWAKTVWAPAQPDQELAWRQIEEAFGYTPNSETYKKRTEHSGWRPSEISVQNSSAAGRLIFHDAWPSQWPPIEVDITNSHHRKYYQGESPPDDTEDPNPVYFPVVSDGIEFQFAVSDRKRQPNSLVENGINWLQGALSAEGAGAKTAAGYGRFLAKEPLPVPESPQITRKQYKLELISMAFLAGADQKSQDCDLRPATLRGLLRWWWRTMHTAHVNLKTLRKLEAAIWGDTDNGSPVRIHLQDRDSPPPKPFKKRDHQRMLGLAYASYGMDEKNSSRWYQPEGSVWQLHVTTRSGYYQTKSNTVRLPSEIIHQQVEVALWLLARFGGAGSRSRKGFGSFADVEIGGITSLEDCKDIGKNLRQICSLTSQGSVEAPSLENAIIMEDQLAGTNNPIQAVNSIGELIRDYAKILKNKDTELLKIFGTPRIGKKYKYEKRQPSPAHWSLSRDHLRNENEIVIRLIGFPSSKLGEKSKDVLTNLRSFAEKELSSKSRNARHVSRPSSSSQHFQRDSKSVKHHSTPETSGTRSTSKLPSPGDRVKAILLDKKTKNNDWIAKHIDSGLEGNMHDSENAPLDATVGQEVELIVASANIKLMAFRWEPLPRKKGRTKRR